MFSRQVTRSRKSTTSSILTRSQTLNPESTQPQQQFNQYDQYILTQMGKASNRLQNSQAVRPTQQWGSYTIPSHNINPSQCSKSYSNKPPLATFHSISSTTSFHPPPLSPRIMTIVKRLISTISPHSYNTTTHRIPTHKHSHKHKNLLTLTSTTTLTQPTLSSHSRHYSNLPLSQIEQRSLRMNTIPITTRRTTIKSTNTSPPLKSPSSSHHKPPLTTSKRFARLDFSRYYFFARNRRMNYLLSRRGLVRPGRKHNYKRWIFKRWQRGFWRYGVARIWGRRIKWFFYLVFWYYLVLYLMPFFLRWQYDLNPRTITRFSKLDYEERWEGKIMSELRRYRHLHRKLSSTMASDPDINLFGLTTPAGKPFRQGLIYYYFMLVIYPFTSGMMDPLLYPRLFFFGLQPYIPEEFDNPRIPQNTLITLSTRDLLKFMSIIQTRMYLATQTDLYVDRNVNSQYNVYDVDNELEEYKLRCKRYRFNLDVLNKTYAMVIHEIFRRVHSAVFYSGRHSVIPSPKYVPSIPRYELSSADLQKLTSLYDTDAPDDVYNLVSSPDGLNRLLSSSNNNNNNNNDEMQNQQRYYTSPDVIYNDEIIKTEIPGLYDRFKRDLKVYGGINNDATTFTRLRYLFRTNNQSFGEFTLSPFIITHNLTSALKNCFIAKESWLMVREVMNFVNVTFDRLTWTGAKTGLEHIKGLDITTTGRDAAVLDYRLHDFQRPNYPLFFTTIQKRLYQIHQVVYSMATQFRREKTMDKDFLEKFQYPIMNLNSDIDEIVHYLTQPELNSHYTKMLQALAEIDHSNNDGPGYDYRRVNLGVLQDRRFKLKQNALILQNVINVIQQDLDIAKATTIRDVVNDSTAIGGITSGNEAGPNQVKRQPFDFRNDGQSSEDPRSNKATPLNAKQFGCEWVLYDLKLQHREMRRISRDLEYFLQSDASSAMDQNVEPCRGERNPIAKGLNLIPFGLGHVPKNILRRMGWIERGSIPLHVLNTPRKGGTSSNGGSFIPGFVSLYNYNNPNNNSITQSIVNKLPNWVKNKLDV